MTGVELTVFVSWILSGGFEVLVRWLVSLFPAAMKTWTETQRAILSAGLGAILQTGAFALAVGLEILPHPDPTWIGWVSALFPYLSLAIGIPAVMSLGFRRQYEKRAVVPGARMTGGIPARWLGHRW